MKAGYAQQATGETTILQQAYLWMFGGLLVTAFTSVGAAMSLDFQQALHSNPILFFGLIIAEFGLVIGISRTVMTLAPAVAMVLFLVYAFLNGLTLSSIFYVYQLGSVSAAFFSSAAVFGVMGVVGYTTKKDLSSIGMIAFMALIGIIIAAVVNFFLHSTMMGMLISFAAVLIFTALTAYDTQQLKRMSMSMPNNGSLGIYGALRLYLDFINIFLSILRLMGNRR